jgi:hypothetical protein
VEPEEVFEKLNRMEVRLDAHLDQLKAKNRDASEASIEKRFEAVDDEIIGENEGDVPTT